MSSAAGYLQIAGMVGGLTASILETIGKRRQFAANARLLRLRGEIAANEVRRAGALLLGEQRAGFGKAGVSGAGTPLDVQAFTAEEVELAALRQQWEFEAARKDELLQRKLALVQGIAKASSALLGGAGGLSDIGAFGGGTGGRQPTALSSGGLGYAAANPSANVTGPGTFGGYLSGLAVGG